MQKVNFYDRSLSSNNQIYSYIKELFRLNFNKNLNRQELDVLGYLLAGRNLENLVRIYPPSQRERQLANHKRIANLLCEKLTFIFKDDVETDNFKTIVEQNYRKRVSSTKTNLRLLLSGHRQPKPVKPNPSKNVGKIKKLPSHLQVTSTQGKSKQERSQSLVSRRNLVVKLRIRDLKIGDRVVKMNKLDDRLGEIIGIDGSNLKVRIQWTDKKCKKGYRNTWNNIKYLTAPS